MIRFELGDKQVGRRFRFGFTRFAERVGRAAARSALEVAEEIEDRVKVQIAGADGEFGLRWPRGFHAEPQVRPGTNEIVIRAWHDIFYWTVHEFGAVIRGKPLLWIPLSFADDAKGVWARDYPGGLFRVDRAGKAPLLLSRETGEPKYFGKESVKVPPRFKIRAIIKDVSTKIRNVYRRNYKATK